MNFGCPDTNLLSLDVKSRLVQVRKIGFSTIVIMRDPAKLKKSESLEIRLPFPTKQAFMARCRDDGRSASDALRAFIDGYLVDETKARPAFRGWRLVAAGSAAALLAAAAAAPTLARPSLAAAQSEAEFKRLDANGDGKLSLVEFQRLVAKP